MAPEQIARKQVSTQELCVPHPHRNCKGNSGPRSKSTGGTPPLSPLSASTAAVDVLAHLADDSTTTYDDKFARVLALHACWKYEDNEEEALDGEALQTRQSARCKELELIVFGFTLHKAQVEAIYTLY